MATTANKNCKQFIGIVTGEDGITADRYLSTGEEVLGEGKVKLLTAKFDDSIGKTIKVETLSTDIEVYNRNGVSFPSLLENDICYPLGAEVEIWQDGYGVFWVECVIQDLEGWVESEVTGFNEAYNYQVKLGRGAKWKGRKTIDAGSSMLNFNSTIETGTPVLCRWFNSLQRWIIIEAACEPDPNYVPSSEEEEEENV